MVESRAPMFVAMATLATLMALAIVSLRIAYRASKKSLIAADYMIIVAMTCSLIHYALDMSLVAYFGYGRHKKDIPQDEYLSVQEGIIIYVLDIVVKGALAFPKLSLCLIYKSLLGGADGRLVRISQILNYTVLGIVVGYYTAVAFVAAFQCDPVPRAWNYAIPGTCIDDTGTVGTVTAAINMSTSIFLIYIPLPVLIKSRRLKSAGPRIQVSQLIALILLGLVDTAMSVVRFFTAFILKDVVQGDFSYAVPPLYVIIIFEYNILIMAASLVVMRNCFQAMHGLLFPNSTLWLNGSSSNSSGGTQKSSKNSSSTNSQGHSQSRSYDMMGSAGGSAAEISYHPPPSSQGSQGLGWSNGGIFKTVDVDMNTRSISMEEILRKEDRSPY